MPKNLNVIVFPIVVASQMAIMMTFILTAVNHGFSDEFPGLWLHQLKFAWPAACIVVFIALYFGRKITPYIVRGLNWLISR